MRCLGGQHLLVPTGPAAREHGGFFRLNSTAACIYELVGDGLDPREIVQRLVSETEAEADEVSRDVAALLALLAKLGALRPAAAGNS